MAQEWIWLIIWVGSFFFFCVNTFGEIEKYDHYNRFQKAFFIFQLTVIIFTLLIAMTNTIFW